MTGNPSLFKEIKEKNLGKVTFSDKGKGKIIGIGKIGKDPSKSIEKVYLVDGLKYNLLSISQLCDKGNQVIFYAFQCVVVDSKSSKVVLHGPRVNNIYVVNDDSISRMLPHVLKLPRVM